MHVLSVPAASTVVVMTLCALALLWFGAMVVPDLLSSRQTPQTSTITGASFRTGNSADYNFALDGAVAPQRRVTSVGAE